MEVKEKTNVNNNILEQIKGVVVNNRIFDGNIEIEDDLVIEVYISNYHHKETIGFYTQENKYLNYIFLLYKGKNPIGFKIWNVERKNNSKCYVIASFIRTDLAKKISFTDTLYIDQQYRGNKFGRLLFEKSLKYLRNNLKGELTISIVSLIPLFHEKLIRNLTKKCSVDSEGLMVKFRFVL